MHQISAESPSWLVESERSISVVTDCVSYLKKLCVAKYLIVLLSLTL
jgi:hypothetical protein